MSTRRRSLMPTMAPPKQPSTSRRRSLMPPKSVAVKSASKLTKKPDTSFVSAENFDFGLAPESPPKGPMTRSRRTSIYTRNQPLIDALPTPKRGRGRPPKAEAVKVKEAPNSKTPKVAKAAVKKTEKQPLTSTTVKAKKSTPKMKMIEPLTPIVELRRLNSNEVKSSAERRTAVLKSALKLPKLSALPKALTPARNNQAVVKKSVFLGTPQAVDPTFLLKRNLKNKVEKDLDNKVSTLPPSPYVMLSGETEDGSPVERFVKVQKPDRTAASKFVTGTPAPPKRRQPFLPVNDGSPELPELPKRTRKSIQTPHNPKRMSSINLSKSFENVSPSILKESAGSMTVTSPVKNTHLVTGELVKACSIM